MTISVDQSRVVHVANGTATFFSSSPIEGLDATNIKVTTISTTGTETVRVLGVDYTITTGGITFASPPANGTSVVIQRIVPLLQPDQYLVNAPFPARVTESRFDQVVMGLQQLSDELGRTLRVSIGEGTFTALLPRPAQRANRLLGFDAAGAPVAVTGNQISDVLITPFGEALLTAVDAAEGRTVLEAAASADVNARLPIDGSQPMTGPLRIVPGTAAAPGLAVDGDTNTGLHRPAADTLAVTTGGTTRLTVSDSAITAALPVVLPADPTAAMQAATKQYVDRGTSGPVTASGSAIDFTGIPSWANQVRVIGMNVTITAAVPRLRVGGSSILTTGYTSAGTSTATGVISTSSTTDFVFCGSDYASTYNFVLTLIRAPASNVWLFHGGGSYPPGPGTVRGAGWIDVGAALQQLRIFVPSGTFSSGSFWVEWRR